LFSCTDDLDWIARASSVLVPLLVGCESGGVALAQFTPWPTNLLPEGDALAALGQNLGSAALPTVCAVRNAGFMSR
jgi:hypothetical protein